MVFKREGMLDLQDVFPLWGFGTIYKEDPMDI